MSASPARRRRALGVDALDGLVPTLAPAVEPAAEPAAPAAAPAADEPRLALAADPPGVVAPDPPPPRTDLRPVPAAPEPVARPSDPPRPDLPAGRARAKVTFALPTDLLEACRDAVDFLSGPPHRLTLAALVEQALRRELAHLRGQHRDAAPFPPRDGPLKTGRPLRS